MYEKPKKPVCIFDETIVARLDLRFLFNVRFAGSRTAPRIERKRKGRITRRSSTMVSD